VKHVGFFLVFLISYGTANLQFSDKKIYLSICDMKSISLIAKI